MVGSDFIGNELAQVQIETERHPAWTSQPGKRDFQPLSTVQSSPNYDTDRLKR